MLVRLFMTASFALFLSIGVVGCGGGSPEEGIPANAGSITPPDPGPAAGPAAPTGAGARK